MRNATRARPALAALSLSDCEATNVRLAYQAGADASSWDAADLASSWCPNPPESEPRGR